MKARQIPLLCLGAVLMAGCASKPPVKTSQQAPRADVAVAPASSKQAPVAPTVPQTPLNGRYSALRVTGDYMGYREVDEFITRMASKHGFPRDYLNGVFSRAQRKEWTLNYLSRETGPSATPRPGAWSRYRSQFLTEQHIAGGVDFWMRHAPALQRASQRYGVPPEYIVGIMGVETIYGRNVGNHRVIDALTTLAFDYPRRANYFSGELENFLVMANTERIDPLQPVGSYAGAMGLGQFMPSSFLRWAVDFDDDGRRNLWQPDDAIGSIANYFAQHGWRRGEPVVTPAVATSPNAQGLQSGYDTHYSPAELVRWGIRPAASVSGGDPVRLLRLSTNSGDEYWLGHQNFYVITRYNHSTHYAMAVHQLAQAVKQRYLGTVAALH
jgi:membrane-bound lytic murein transglycosylase B